MSGINTTYSAHQGDQPPQFAPGHPSFACEIPLSQVRTVGHHMGVLTIASFPSQGVPCWYRRAAITFFVVQLLSCVQLSATPWTAARQASLSITSSLSLFKLMTIVSVMPSNHLIFCHPLLLLPSIFPRFRVFSNELVLHIRWPKY